MTARKQAHPLPFRGHKKYFVRNRRPARTLLMALFRMNHTFQSGRLAAMRFVRGRPLGLESGVNLIVFWLIDAIIEAVRKYPFGMIARGLAEIRGVPTKIQFSLLNARVVFFSGGPPVSTILVTRDDQYERPEFPTD
jgi:hypothetical protein